MCRNTGGYPKTSTDLHRLTVPLLQALTAITAVTKLQAPDPPPLLALDLYHIRKIGIQHIGDLIAEHGRTILKPTQVKLLTGCHITPRTRKALTRLAHMLAKPPGHSLEDYNKDTMNPLPTQLTIHPTMPES
jgi:hypothetical protein